METQTIRKILTRDFIFCFFAQFTFTFVFFNLIPTLPIYLSRLGSTEAEIGVLIGVSAASSLVLRPLVGRALLKIPEKTFMIAGLLLVAFTSAAYLFAPPFWPFLIVRVFQGIGFALFSTASFTLIANISSKAHRGQSLGYFTLSFTIAGALAPPLGMFLINRFSFPVLFLACSGLSLCSLLITHQLGIRQVAPLQDSSIRRRFASQSGSNFAVYYWFFLLLHLGSSHCLFPSLCNKSWSDQPWVFLLYDCHCTHFKSFFRREDLRS